MSKKDSKCVRYYILEERKQCTSLRARKLKEWDASFRNIRQNEFEKWIFFPTPTSPPCIVFRGVTWPITLDHPYPRRQCLGNVKSSLHTCMFTQAHTHTHDAGRTGSGQRDDTNTHHAGRTGSAQSRLPHGGLSFVYGLQILENFSSTSKDISWIS